MPTHVTRILTNPLYAGQARYNRSDRKGRGKPESEQVTVQVPAIVSESDVKAVKRMAKRNQRDSQHPRDKNSQYLLSGLIRCHCGQAMVTATTRSGRNKKQYLYRYYRCTGQENHKTPCRPGVRVSAESIEDAVLGMLVETFSDPDKVLMAIDADAKQKLARRGEEDEFKATLIQNLMRAENERDSYITMCAKKLITEADLSRKLKALSKDVEGWQKELALIDEREQQDIRAQEIAHVAKDIAAQMEQIAEEMTLDEKKKLVRTLVDRVWVDAENRITLDCVVPGLIGERTTQTTRL